MIHKMTMEYMNHDDPNLTVKVIDIDTPGTGRIPRTLDQTLQRVAARVEEGIRACV